MNHSPNVKQVETVLKYIKEQLYSGSLQPGERLPAERRLAEMLGVGRAHVRTAFQKLEFYASVIRRSSTCIFSCATTVPLWGKVWTMP